MTQRCRWGSRVIHAVTHLAPPISQRLEVIALTVAVCALIFELVRRKRLMERYAILWLVAGVTVLVLGLWQGLLTTLSHAVGIYYPPSALFAVAFLFVLVILMHFSTTVSRLSDQNKVLAQRLALLQERFDEGSSAVAEARVQLEAQPREVPTAPKGVSHLGGDHADRVAHSTEHEDGERGGS
jgi:hypothetical protein